MEDRRVYGYVDGNPVYSADEFRFKARGFGAIEEGKRGDRFLMKYAEEVTHVWYEAGHHRTFIGFYLSDYALSEPYASLTRSEFNRLKALQAEARAEAERKEAEKEWKYDHTIYYADNSEEEVWINKYGETKNVMTVAPHGDACY